jgi:hypothetical protein
MGRAHGQRLHDRSTGADHAWSVEGTGLVPYRPYRVQPAFQILVRSRDAVLHREFGAPWVPTPDGHYLTRERSGNPSRSNAPDTIPAWSTGRRTAWAIAPTGQGRHRDPRQWDQRVVSCRRGSHRRTRESCFRGVTQAGALRKGQACLSCRHAILSHSALLRRAWQQFRMGRTAGGHRDVSDMFAAA